MTDAGVRICACSASRRGLRLVRLSGVPQYRTPVLRAPIAWIGACYRRQTHDQPAGWRLVSRGARSEVSNRRRSRRRHPVRRLHEAGSPSRCQRRSGARVPAEAVPEDPDENGVLGILEHGYRSWRRIHRAACGVLTRTGTGRDRERTAWPPNGADVAWAALRPRAHLAAPFEALWRRPIEECSMHPSAGARGDCSPLPHLRRSIRDTDLGLAALGSGARSLYRYARNRTPSPVRHALGISGRKGELTYSVRTKSFRPIRFWKPSWSNRFRNGGTSDLGVQPAATDATMSRRG